MKVENHEVDIFDLDCGEESAVTTPTTIEEWVAYHKRTVIIPLPKPVVIQAKIDLARTKGIAFSEKPEDSDLFLAYVMAYQELSDAEKFEMERQAKAGIDASNTKLRTLSAEQLTIRANEVVRVFNDFECVLDYWSYLKETRKKNSCVYFILNEENGMVKIGYSTNDAASRLKSMNSAVKHAGETPLRLRVLKEYTTLREFAPRLEHLLHKEYAHLRKQGEWFALTNLPTEEQLASWEIDVADRLNLSIKRPANIAAAFASQNPSEYFQNQAIELLEKDVAWMEKELNDFFCWLEGWVKL